MTNIYLLFLVMSMVAFFVLVGMKRKKKNTQAHYRLVDITVIIPFRNEEKSLPSLLESIKRQEKLPKEIIFINDHSIDSSLEMIQNFQNKIANLTILNLPPEKKGKKEAIRYGIENATTPFILTLDADVILPLLYCKTLENTPLNCMTGFPVVMEKENKKQNFFGVEYLFFNAFTYLISPFHVLSVSGANLIFNQEKIDYHKQLVTHAHIASGDDYFLMKAFQKERKEVAVNNHPDLAVTTKVPSSFREYLFQRIRWVSKSKVQFASREFFISLYIGGYFFLGILAISNALFDKNYADFFAIIGLRFVVDCWVFYHYTHRLKAFKGVGYLFLFSWIYPFILMLILVGSWIFTPVWKGRSLS